MIKVNMSEDPLGEVAAFDWAAFRLRRSKPFSDPSLCGLPGGSA